MRAERVAPTDARERAASADRFAAVLAAVLAVAAAAALVLLAIRLVAVASGSAYSPWREMGLPNDHGGRIGLLLAALVVSLLLLAVGLHRHDPVLHFTSQEGEVRIRAGALEEAVLAEVTLHPDVLRADPRVRMRGGRPRVEVDVAARPMADARALRGLVEEAVNGVLCSTAGLPPVTLSVEVEAVGVGRLYRYL